MAVDEYSFTKQGTVPFKWEIKPGVPRVHQPQQHFHNIHHHLSLQNPPQKLRPPPSKSYFNPPPELRTRSFRSAPRTRSEHRRFELPTLVQPQTVPPGCFPTSSLLRRKDDKKSIVPKPESYYEPDYRSNKARWSFSRQKSLSPFRGSPASSYSSYQSSPRPVNDAEWAGFELF